MRASLHLNPTLDQSREFRVSSKPSLSIPEVDFCVADDAARHAPNNVFRVSGAPPQLENDRHPRLLEPVAAEYSAGSFTSNDLGFARSEAHTARPFTRTGRALT